MDTPMSIDEIRTLKAGDLIRCGNFNFKVIEFDPVWDTLTYSDNFGNRACNSAEACADFNFAKAWAV